MEKCGTLASWAQEARGPSGWDLRPVACLLADAARGQGLSKSVSLWLAGASASERCGGGIQKALTKRMEEASKPRVLCGVAATRISQ